MELDLDEVKALARTIGFELSVRLFGCRGLILYLIIVFPLAENQDERTIDTTYTNNAQGLLGYVYHAAFWTATKI